MSSQVFYHLLPGYNFIIKIISNMKTIRFAIFSLLIVIAKICYGQQSDYNDNSKNFFHRIGYRLTLYNYNKYDSNVLRLTSGLGDFAAQLSPSISLSYPFSSNTKITAQYLYGIEKYASTSFLNTNYWKMGLKLSNYFSPKWNTKLYSYYIHSHQPDILTTIPSVYKFAMYDQYLNAIRINWLISDITLYSFEYSFIQRNYTHLLTLSLEKEVDNSNYLTFSWNHQFSKITFGYIKVGLIINNSNNKNYDYNNQFLDLFLSNDVGAGFRIQFEEMVSSLKFSSRRISIDPNGTRQDFINSFMIGVKKTINKNVSLNLDYYLIKDFSNEPYRDFLSNSIIFGIQFAINKNSDLGEQFSPLNSDLGKSRGLNELNAKAEQLTNAGYQYIVKKDYDKALSYSLKAISLDNNIEQAHINAGISYYKKGMTKYAVEEWEKALRLNPKNIKLHKILDQAEEEINHK